MTIEHAEKYLDKLRKKSPSVNYWGDWEHDYTKRQAKKLAKAAGDYVCSFKDVSPSHYRHESNALPCEWMRFCVRIYDESQRLREIAEGKR